MTPIVEAIIKLSNSLFLLRQLLVKSDKPDAIQFKILSDIVIEQMAELTGLLLEVRP